MKTQTECGQVILFQQDMDETGDVWHDAPTNIGQTTLIVGLTDAGGTQLATTIQALITIVLPADKKEKLRWPIVNSTGHLNFYC